MENKLDFNKYLIILQTKIYYSGCNTACMLYNRTYSVLKSRSASGFVEYGRQKLVFTNGRKGCDSP